MRNLRHSIELDLIPHCRSPDQARRLGRESGANDRPAPPLRRARTEALNGHSAGTLLADLGLPAGKRPARSQGRGGLLFLALARRLAQS